MCVLSTATVFLAKTVDSYETPLFVPTVTPESIETLPTIISASMLVIVTFAVTSMVSAYASVSNTALFFPGHLRRCFPGRSSTFIGVFIFSIVAGNHACPIDALLRIDKTA